MQSVALPFGVAGLDRVSGVLAVRPGALRDARNVVVRHGEVTLRRGMAVAATLPDQGGDPCTHIPLIAALRFEAVMVAVGYYEDSRELHLYRLSADGASITHIGKLFDLHQDANEPPILHAAEVGGRLFIAHDEPLQSRRGATMVYDPLGSTALFQLEAEFSGSGSAPVRFRGVIAWHDYLIGWGFASATVSRPEIVRISLPGQPLEWDREHYFVAGTRGDPVLSVRPAGGNLLVRKASSTHQIVGTSHLDFGILPLHSLTGTRGHRLSIEIDGRLYDWSAEGPVLYTGHAEPGRLETPLDLSGPQPDGFGSLDYDSGYVQYLPDQRALEWVFGTQSFLLSLESGEWSYGESAVERTAGALIYAGESLADDLNQPPSGYASDLVVVPSATVATLTWDNNDHDGNETAEVWLRLLPSGPWTLVAQVDVSTGPSETIPLENLEVAEDYAVAIRFRRGGYYTTGYESSDPANWPSASKTTFSTILETPDIDSAVWARTSAATERVRVVIIPKDPNASHQILRDLVVVDTLGPGETVYDDFGISGETTHAFAVRAVIGSSTSMASENVLVWTGPEPPPESAEYTGTDEHPCGAGSKGYLVSWVPGDNSYHTEIVTDDGTYIYNPGTTSTAEPVCADEEDPSIQMRHRVTTFGVHDYSESITAEPA